MTDEVARLYSLPLDEFVAERNASARRLRKEGDRAAADEVKRLRKPNRPAWAINQAVRADARTAKRLVKAGEKLEKAQRVALGGKGSSKLREAMAEHGDAVEQMTEAAAQGLEPKERGGVTLDRIRETLRAVAGDEELRAEFVDGRLARDREAVGFGGETPDAAPKRSPKRGRAKADDAGAAATARRREAARAVSSAERALRTATRRVETTQARLGRARQALDEAQADHEDAERERRERDAELSDARAALSGLSD